MNSSQPSVSRQFVVLDSRTAELFGGEELVMVKGCLVAKRW